MTNKYKPTRTILQGNKELAASHSGDIGRVLFQLENIQKTNKYINTLYKQYEDGTTIKAVTNIGGIDIIEIRSPFKHGDISKEEWVTGHEEFLVMIIKVVDSIIHWSATESNYIAGYVAENFVGRYREYVEKDEEGKIKYTKSEGPSEDRTDKKLKELDPLKSNALWGVVGDGNYSGEDNGIYQSKTITYANNSSTITYDLSGKVEYQLSSVVIDTESSEADDFPSVGTIVKGAVLTSCDDDNYMFIYGYYEYAGYSTDSFSYYIPETTITHIWGANDIYYKIDVNINGVVTNCYTSPLDEALTRVYFDDRTMTDGHEETGYHSTIESRYVYASKPILCDIYYYGDEPVFIYGYRIANAVSSYYPGIIYHQDPDAFIEYCVFYKNKTHKIRFKYLYDSYTESGSESVGLNSHFNFDEAEYEDSDGNTKTISFSDKFDEKYGFPNPTGWDYDLGDAYMFRSVIAGKITLDTKKKK